MNEIKNDIIEQYGDKQYAAWYNEVMNARKDSRPAQGVPEHVLEYILFENEIKDVEANKMLEAGDE